MDATRNESTANDESDEYSDVSNIDWPNLMPVLVEWVVMIIVACCASLLVINYVYIQ